MPRAAWEAYLRKAFAENRPYDVFVREMLVQRRHRPEDARRAAKFLLDRDLEPNLVTRDLARIFLGRNLQCAQCHDHPLVDDYKQDEYYGIQAFLNRSFLFPNAQAAERRHRREGRGRRRPSSSVFDKTKKQNTTAPRCRGGKAIDEPKPEKGKEYKVAPAKNVRPVPTFSRREQLAGGDDVAGEPGLRPHRGQPHLGDDAGPRAGQPGGPGSPPITRRRTRNCSICSPTEFVAHKYDVKWLIREIALSDTYQRSSERPRGGWRTSPANAISWRS